jgi:hypothetical protein
MCDRRKLKLLPQKVALPRKLGDVDFWVDRYVWTSLAAVAPSSWRWDSTAAPMETALPYRPAAGLMQHQVSCTGFGFNEGTAI